MKATTGTAANPASSLSDARAAVENPFSDNIQNPQLDPHNPNFNIRAWLANLRCFTSHHPLQLGVCFRNLSVSGSGSPTDYQKTVANIFLSLPTLIQWLLPTGPAAAAPGGRYRVRRMPILRDIDGVVRHGEMLLVLGRPGSGCSTLLKTIAGDTHGLHIETPQSHLSYQGVAPAQLRAQFRGEAIYMAENDVHFPQLTVDETLSFAALARTSDGVGISFPGVTRAACAARLKDVAMASFGLLGVANTRVGSELIKGVSGGERKRVSIAEAMLSGSALQCWDNSTRGLDSANAVEFCATLRAAAELAGSTMLVALYQAPQAAYNVRKCKNKQLKKRYANK
jgi:ATP-binding cassette, subfamily G (WHITE), member 2, PDR